jgi:hypothetical protein
VWIQEWRRSLVECPIDSVGGAEGAIALLMHSSEDQYTTMVLNESKLTSEQRARLWHWRLGHCNPQLTVDMSKQGLDYPD